MKVAICTIVFYNPKYIIGALVLGRSLQLTGNNCDLVCMVTPDIEAADRAALALIFDKVIEVQYIEFPTKPSVSNKWQTTYSPWIDKSFTKWRCMELTDYDKVLFLDADMLVVRNCMDLFELRAPATVLSNSVTHIKNTFIPTAESSKMHGASIGPEQLKLAENNLTHHLVNASCCLLKTSDAAMQLYIKLIADHVAKYGTYGNGHAFHGADEQSLFKFFTFVGNISWSNISLSYCTIPWNKPQLWGNDRTHIIHFYGIKPWDEDPYKWQDLGAWYKMLNFIVAENPEIKKYLQKFIFLKLNPVDETKCFWCGQEGHKMYEIENNQLKITCDQL